MLQTSQFLNKLSESATLKMAQLSRELKAQGKDIISLSLGEPDFDTPERLTPEPGQRRAGCSPLYNRA